MDVTTRRKVLIIDDDRLLCDTLLEGLADLPVDCTAVHTGSQGLHCCTDSPADIVLLDQKLPDGRGIDFCAPILECSDRAKIIFITAYPSFENAVQAIQAGAHDYLSKPFELGELRLAITKSLRTLELEQIEQATHYQNRQDSHRAVLIGARGGLEKVQHLVALAARNRAPVLITGETGTGKTVAAKAIHYQGPRADMAFVSINCAAIPENLMEAELFGYEKGAFTGALKTTRGIFELAGSGTLFLDEIGEIPIHLQSKLLGVLDDARVKRIGGQSLKPVNARIIAATNTDLEDAVQSGRFRQDLYYRLSVVRIHIPPLRRRLEDMDRLCRFFIAEIAPDQHLRIEAEDMAALKRYPWPGNVRELRNIIERAIIVRKSARLAPGLLLQDARSPQPSPASTCAETSEAAIASLQEMETVHIANALSHYRRNYTRTAEALGISRSTLMRKIKQYGLNRIQPGQPAIVD